MNGFTLRRSAARPCRQGVGTAPDSTAALRRGSAPAPIKRPRSSSIRAGAGYGSDRLLHYKAHNEMVGGARRRCQTPAPWIVRNATRAGVWPQAAWVWTGVPARIGPPRSNHRGTRPRLAGISARTDRAGQLAEKKGLEVRFGPVACWLHHWLADRRPVTPSEGFEGTAAIREGRPRIASGSDGGCNIQRLPSPPGPPHGRKTRSRIGSPLRR